MHYGINPPNFPEHCYVWGVEFDICHTLNCNKGGLIMARHNEIFDGVSDLASKASTPTHVCDDPKIYTGCAVCGIKDKLKGSSSKDKE